MAWMLNIIIIVMVSKLHSQDRFLVITVGHCYNTAQHNIIEHIAGLWLNKHNQSLNSPKTLHRGYPAKRALSAMGKHGG